MNPWDELVETSIAFGTVGLVASALIAGLWLGFRPRLFPFARLRPGNWSGFTFLGHYLLLRVCAIFAVSVVVGLGLSSWWLPPEADGLRIGNLASPLTVVTFLAASFSLLHAQRGASISKVGLSLHRWPANVILGAAAFLVASPVVLGIHFLIWSPTDAPHGLERLARQGLFGYEWALLLVQAVVFAPIVEEWLFRGLLQGWLRRTNLLGHTALFWGIIVASLDSPVADATRKDAASFDYPPVIFAVVMGAIYVGGIMMLYRPVTRRGLGVFFATEMPPVDARIDFWTASLFEAEGREHRTAPWCDFSQEWGRWKHRNALWAIYGSSLLFAVVHPWPTCIPLFVMGLVLGGLAYRTQNLVPGIVMHALFNLVAFIGLWQSVHRRDIGSDSSVAVASPPENGIVTVVPGD